MSYPLVLELADDGIAVAVTGRVFGFSKQAFYKWRVNPVSDRDWTDAHLVNAAYGIHHDDPEFGYWFALFTVRQFGLTIHPVGVGSYLCRLGLDRLLGLADRAAALVLSRHDFSSLKLSTRFGYEVSWTSRSVGPLTRALRMTPVVIPVLIGYLDGSASGKGISPCKVGTPCTRTVDGAAKPFSTSRRAAGRIITGLTPNRRAKSPIVTGLLRPAPEASICRMCWSMFMALNSFAQSSRGPDIAGGPRFGLSGSKDGRDPLIGSGRQSPRARLTECQR